MTQIRNRIDWNDVGERLAMPAADIDRNLKHRNMIEVYRQRALRLAHRGNRATVYANTRIITFHLGSERFGIELGDIEHVFPRPAITPVPNTGRHLLGVANLNGSVRSVVDIRVLLNLPDDTTDRGYVILVRNSDRSLGLWAQEVDGVSQISLDRLMDADYGEGNAHGGVVRGVTEDHTLILDIDVLMQKVAGMTRQATISPN